MSDNKETATESELRLNAIIDGSPIPKFVIDKDHRVIYWNKALERLSGIKSEEIIGTNQQWRAFYPNARPTMADLLVDNKIEKIPRWYEGKYAKSKVSDGAYEAIDYFPRSGASGVWLFFTAVPILDFHGKIIGAVETLEDITDRKLAENKIRAMSQFQESIIANANVWLMVLDDRGNIQLWNNAAAEISGYPPDEVVGNNSIWRSLYPDLDYRKKITAMLTGIISEKKYLQNFETSIITKSGEKKVILWNTRSLETGEQPARFVAIGVDITKSVQAEQALRESEERYRNVVESQTEFVTRFRPDGTHLYANEAYCSYFGKTCDHIINNKFTPDIPREDKELVREHFASLTTQHPVATIEHRIVMPDGSTRWQQWNDRAIFDAEGNTVEYQSVGRDITDRKMMESEIRSLNMALEERVKNRTADLEKTNILLQKEVMYHMEAQKKIQDSLDEKVVLLREIHHRVKNNLQIIISLLNLQSRYITDEKTKQAIKESQNRLKAMSLVHEKLYQSQNISMIDLDNYIKFLATSLLSFYEIKQITLKTDINNISVGINSAIPIGLIINELVSNSLKHAFPYEQKGRIDISITRKNDRIFIEYRDDGIGIPKDFDWRNTQSLGLRLVISLVEQMDGTIELDQSAGTAFSIVLQEKE